MDTQKRDNRFDWHPLDEVLSERLLAMQDRELIDIEVADKPICVVRIEDGWKGILNKCPHAGKPLHEGFCNKRGVVVCPSHHYKFHLSSGLSADGNHYKLQTFPFIIENGCMWVGVRKY